MSVSRSDFVSFRSPSISPSISAEEWIFMTPKSQSEVGSGRLRSVGKGGEHPRATKTAPLTRCPRRRAVGTLPCRTARGERAGEDCVGAVAQQTERDEAQTRAPRPASAIGPRPGSTNCGRKATKNSAVFGLRTFTTTPWPYTRCIDAGSAAARSSLAPTPNSRISPSPTRYAAPASLTASNAVADARQQRGQAGGGSRDMHDRAGVNPEDGDQAGAPSLGCAPGDDVDDRRAGDDEQCERSRGEQAEGGRSRASVTLTRSVPRTPPRSAASPVARAASRRGSRPSRDARRRARGSRRRGDPSPRAGARSRRCRSTKHQLP